MSGGSAFRPDEEIGDSRHDFPIVAMGGPFAAARAIDTAGAEKVPGRFAVASFSPPLDAAGNSVRGRRALASIVQRLGGSLFATASASRTPRTGADNTPASPQRGAIAGATPAGKL
ncbi:MAG TPA: glutaminase [Polyangia bacterium]|nr:glutaminase [Polyangia bacterium]